MNPTDPAMLPRYDAEEVARIFDTDWRLVSMPEDGLSFRDLCWASLHTPAPGRLWAPDYGREHDDVPSRHLDGYTPESLRWRSLCIDPHVCDGAVHVAGTEVRARRVALAVVTLLDTDPMGRGGAVAEAANAASITPDAVRDCCAYAGV